MGQPDYGDITFCVDSEKQNSIKSALESQVGGDHYKKLGDYQPFVVLKHWLTPEEYRGWAKGNAIVYAARERDKGKDGDIDKAIHTLQLYRELKDSEPEKSDRYQAYMDQLRRFIERHRIPQGRVDIICKVSDEWSEYQASKPEEEANEAADVCNVLFQLIRYHGHDPLTLMSYKLTVTDAKYLARVGVKA